MSTIARSAALSKKNNTLDRKQSKYNMFKPLSSVADVACILSAVYMCYGEVFYQNGCNRCMDRNGLGYRS